MELKQTRNARHMLMTDSRLEPGDILAIHRGGSRHIVLEAQKPDWEWLKGAYAFLRLSHVPPGHARWPDDVYEDDPVIVIGKASDPDIKEKLKKYGVKKYEPWKF